MGARGGRMLLPVGGARGGHSPVTWSVMVAGTVVAGAASLTCIPVCYAWAPVSWSAGPAPTLPLARTGPATFRCMHVPRRVLGLVMPPFLRTYQ
jgi:hypothetical protein